VIQARDSPVSEINPGSRFLASLHTLFTFYGSRSPFQHDLLEKNMDDWGISSSRKTILLIAGIKQVNNEH
jgi:hypothetical protein